MTKIVPVFDYFWSENRLFDRESWLVGGGESTATVCVCGRHGGTPPTAQLTQLVCLHTLNSKLVNTGAHWTTLDSRAEAASPPPLVLT